VKTFDCPVPGCTAAIAPSPFVGSIVLTCPCCGTELVVATDGGLSFESCTLRASRRLNGHPAVPPLAPDSGRRVG
jgi:hypothetical protein